MASICGIFLCAILVQSAVPADEIRALPGLTLNVNFKHYSGYLKASQTRHLHYWFVESQNEPSRDPLLIWFNGGPGCSSLLGVLSEHGPYILDFDKHTLKENAFAWNKFANVLYMESPAGVGFSYVDNDDDGVYNDNRTSAESYAAIKEFFGKFPLFRNSSVFVVGESYGGMYAPILATRILEGQRNFTINLMGLAIGNGWVDRDLGLATASLWFYAHNLMDESDWRQRKDCCGGDVDACDLNTVSAHCRALFLSLLQKDDPVPQPANTYDLYRNCRTNNDMALFRLAGFRRSGTISPPSSLPSCDPDVGAYLNRLDVRKALNIPDSLPKWHGCSKRVFEAYGTPVVDWYPSVRKEVQKALASGIRVLLYYGDTDALCNALMGQKFAASLGLNQSAPTSPWTYGAEMGGMKTVYEDDLTFITVRGVGHMVPQWAPARIYQAMSRFVINEEI